MKNIGIICEYNPFHNGHARQIQAVKEQGSVICLMSGAYVQRGEPAVISKPDRAEAAVRCGASLVLELPITYALRSAEGFAEGGVEIFSRMGGVDCLSFGSELGQAEKLLELAGCLLRADFPEALKIELSKGLSFPAAREKAVKALGAEGEILKNPNDILGVEYCKALLKRQSPIKPLVIERNGSYHEGTDPEAPSASYLRSLEDWTGFMPPEVLEIQSKARRHSLPAGERAMLARLRSMTEEEFSALPFGAEGLWRKLMQACRQENTLEDIIVSAKSKRYTRSRLMRMLLCAFLGLTEELMMQEAPYVRVLAMNASGGKILREARKRGELMLLNPGQMPPGAYAQLERRAEALYGLFARGTTEGPANPQVLRHSALTK